MAAAPFRLFILGNLPSARGDVELVLLADYHHSRALVRTVLRAGDLDWFRAQILDLRGFVEAGSPTIDQPFLEQLGGRLFDLVVRGAVHDLFVMATAQRSDLVAFELFVESNALASWPWEYLFDPGTRMFVCREFHPISRSIFGRSLSIPDEMARDLLRMLVVIASPIDAEIDVQEEIRLLETVFGRFLAPDKFEIVVEALSAIELIARLQTSRGRFDIVHFLGHSGFDLARGEGYLRMTKAGASESTRLYANDFARAVADSGIRLAFLNACETGRVAVAEDPARSSVAAALLGRGIPGVVAHQFSVPDNGAHVFASVFYSMLAVGSPLADAVRGGRMVIGQPEDGRFCDWGIPVLYTRDPQLVVFPYAGDVDKWPRVRSSGEEALSRLIRPAPGATPGSGPRPAAKKGAVLEVASGAEGETKGDAEDEAEEFSSCERPAIRAREQDPEGTRGPVGGPPPTIALPGGPAAASFVRAPRLTVAIVDIDANAGFLASALEAANQQQDYYEFQLAYLPVPRGAIRNQVFGAVLPQLFLPALEEFARGTPRQLGTDRVCFITRNLLAGDDARGQFCNHFGATLVDDPAVFFISTADLRRFAREAGTTFAKAALRVCLSMLVASDTRWGLGYHEETAGCLLDYCADRHDMVVGLRHTRFDHRRCRSKIMDERMLAAIDTLVAL